MEQTYIEHHGIQGQKWGLRRYQNKDGSLTNAGKSRYREDGTKLNLDNMTDSELSSATSRLKAEKSYIDALRDYDKSQKTAHSTATKIAAITAGALGTMLLTNYLSDGDPKKGKQLVKAALLTAGTTVIPAYLSDKGYK